MLDPKTIREQADRVRWACQVKLRDPAVVDRFLAVDEGWRRETAKVDELRALRNTRSKEIGQLHGEARETARLEMQTLKEDLRLAEEARDRFAQEREQLLLEMPNIPEAEVPVGADETANVEVRRWGQPPAPEATPRDHLQLMQARDWVDTDRPPRFAGARAYVLKGQGALLEMAILRLAADILSARGFQLFSVPVMVDEAALYGTGYFPDHEGQIYALERENKYLVGTAEVSLVSYHMNEILAESELPKRYAGWSVCFRREAGSAGRDVRGLYRVHQFYKVEQVVISRADKELSRQLHEELLGNAEAVMQALELPYRVMLLSTAEIGQGQVLKHDIETWMPSRAAYSETHSCSSFYDYQARRAGIRYRDEEGQVRFAYTLNNTAIATPRVLIPFVEVHQLPDGRIRVPKALRPYLQGSEVL